MGYIMTNGEERLFESQQMLSRGQVKFRNKQEVHVYQVP
jgi:hypothetical protein